MTMDLFPSRNLLRAAFICLVIVISIVWWGHAVQFERGEIFLEEGILQSEYRTMAEEETLSLGVTLLLDRVVLDYGPLMLKMTATFPETGSSPVAFKIVENGANVQIGDSGVFQQKAPFVESMNHAKWPCPLLGTK